MITWILILTMTAYKGGIAIETVMGFKTVEECQAAAVQWSASIKPMGDQYRSATCVKQTKP